jgi:hypothetical protein
MKNFFGSFLDFITGGFFNVVGAAARSLFSKKKYAQLFEEPMSNYVGMAIFTLILLAVFVYIKFSVV